ncbi:MAG: hypothetical protein HN750_17480 [Gemmatimonadales bacterium]|jgi:hypothetical protein|nr:hypothetical protein [Gemmatimonadales bacterium]
MYDEMPDDTAESKRLVLPGGDEQQDRKRHAHVAIELQPVTVAAATTMASRRRRAESSSRPRRMSELGSVPAGSTLRL